MHHYGLKSFLMVATLSMQSSFMRDSNCTKEFILWLFVVFYTSVTATLMASTAQADIIGKASVVDGDTITIRDQRIRLYGIDAPESSQRCTKTGKSYACGKDAAFVLDGLVADKTVRCIQGDVDRYNRIVAICYVDNAEINAKMVSSGNALAYRKYSLDYVSEEDKARIEGLGVWGGTFEKPWEYRAKIRVVQPELVPRDSKCRIKGNIGSTGKRLYHTPSGYSYADTRINEKRGERWFCTEEEARREGWTKAN